MLGEAVGEANCTGERRWTPGLDRQVPDRWIDTLAVDVLFAIGERNAARRQAGELLRTMIDREVSIGQAVA